MVRAGMWVLATISGLAVVPARAEDTRETVSAPAGRVVLRVHAIGAQVYECRRGSDGALAWSFREPIATLLKDGMTVGRHFAGPTWEASDGSRIVGKATAHAPGATVSDIPWLKLTTSEHAGKGMLEDVAIVQRVDTAGGMKVGACSTEGSLAAEPYSADYVFSRP